MPHKAERALGQAGELRAGSRAQPALGAAHAVPRAHKPVIQPRFSRPAHGSRRRRRPGQRRRALRLWGRGGRKNRKHRPVSVLAAGARQGATPVGTTSAGRLGSSTATSARRVAALSQPVGQLSDSASSTCSRRRSALSWAGVRKSVGFVTTPSCSRLQSLKSTSQLRAVAERAPAARIRLRCLLSPTSLQLSSSLPAGDGARAASDVIPNASGVTLALVFLTRAASRIAFTAAWAVANSGRSRADPWRRTHASEASLRPMREGRGVCERQERAIVSDRNARFPYDSEEDSRRERLISCGTMGAVGPTRSRHRSVRVNAYSVNSYSTRLAVAHPLSPLGQHLGVALRPDDALLGLAHLLQSARQAVTSASNTHTQVGSGDYASHERRAASAHRRLRGGGLHS